MSFFSRMFEAAPTPLQKAIDNVMEPASGGFRLGPDSFGLRHGELQIRR